jgi:hypothetical protein
MRRTAGWRRGRLLMAVASAVIAGFAVLSVPASAQAATNNVSGRTVSAVTIAEHQAALPSAVITYHDSQCAPNFWLWTESVYVKVGVCLDVYYNRIGSYDRIRQILVGIHLRDINVTGFWILYVQHLGQAQSATKYYHVTSRWGTVAIWLHTWYNVWRNVPRHSWICDAFYRAPNTSLRKLCIQPRFLPDPARGMMAWDFFLAPSASRPRGRHRPLGVERGADRHIPGKLMSKAVSVKLLTWKTQHGNIMTLIARVMSDVGAFDLSLFASAHLLAIW